LSTESDAENIWDVEICMLYFTQLVISF